MDIADVLSLSDDIEFTIALSDMVCPKAYTLGIDALTEAERVVFLVDETERELGNGGFHQFFENLVGDHASEVVTAFRAIGAHRLAAIVAAAVAVFPDTGPSPAQPQRWAQIAAMDDVAKAHWDVLTEAFDRYPDPVTELKRSFVARRRAEFGS
ncbi:MAG: hypothetical protein AMXMBFR53_35300 [Gemmatimonadota bacterium]